MEVDFAFIFQINDLGWDRTGLAHNSYLKDSNVTADDSCLYSISDISVKALDF